MDFSKYLIKEGALTEKQATEMLEQAKRMGKTLEEILISKKAVQEQALFEMKSRFLKVPLKKVVLEEIPAEAFTIIPKESIEFYKVVPLGVDKKQGVLDVGMVYPESQQAQEALKFLSRQQKLALRISLVGFSDFAKYLKRFKAPEKEVEKALAKLEEEIKTEKDLKKETVKASKKAGASESLSEEAPIIRMVAVILRQAVEGKASDIHIEPTTDDLRVRYRLDGILYSSLMLPLKVHPAVVARIKILSRLKIDETRIPQDGRFSTHLGGKRIDFRVSTFPTTLGEKVVIRVLDPSESVESLSKLGLIGRNLEIVEKSIKSPYGMILVTGPTGSGKTTTLYTILRILNQEKTNIVTLEDPVEYFMSGVNQSQVMPEIEYTFARGLRQILRQDPDVIMVGEIRDAETANLAIHAALTGHLVLSTLHTTSAAGVIPRLLDMSIKPFLISPTLSVAISQRLMRVLCPHCKNKVKLHGEQKKYILEKLKKLPSNVRDKIKIGSDSFIYEGKGCKKCNNTGYSGRIGIFEVLKMTDSLADIITQGPTEQAISKEGERQGMTTMEGDGILKVLEGITSIEEVMRVAEEN